MASSTWSGFFKRSRRAPDQATPDASTEDSRDRQAGGVEVAFESLEYDDGQPFIALVFLRDGVPLEPSGRVFTFELAPGTPKLEADTLASLLGRQVTHLIETRVDTGTSSDSRARQDEGGSP